MNTFSKLLIVVATAAALGATNSASALSYQPSYVDLRDDSYVAHDNFSDYGYRVPHGSDRLGFDRGREQFLIAGHDRRR
jgi:hypothetical protein